MAPGHAIRTRAGDFCVITARLRNFCIARWIAPYAAPFYALIRRVPHKAKGRRAMLRAGPEAMNFLSRQGGGTLPAVVRERPVGFGHTVGVFALLHGRAAIVRGVDDLA